MTLSARDLTRIRALSTSWLEDECTITRPDSGQSTDGFNDGTPTTIATAVACRLDPASSRSNESMNAMGAQSANEWNITLSHDVAVLKPLDTITVTGVSGVFEVQSVTSERGIQCDVVANCVKREAV